MTPAHRIEATLAEDGKLSLHHLPFRAGQSVEVIVMPTAHATPESHTLRGSILRYDLPTEPVAESDWGTLKRSF